MTKAERFAFVAGGTVQAGNGVYVERSADRDLLQHCRAGDFSYILTSRQMGKSSLMMRTAETLMAEGIKPVIVDLTEFGAQTTAEQWYKGFLLSVHDQLGLRTSLSEWWDARADHTFGQRFVQYLRDVALSERSERIVVFVDEIDTTLRLDFTDDFFTAIRFLYQNRAAEPALGRLSFVLIGVATPGDLIKDTARTPFNIGNRVELTDFTVEEAGVLTRHLPAPEQTGKDVIGWTLRWTGGHPYLTLRTLRSLAEAPPGDWTKEHVDQRIRALFLDERAETDSNLQFVRDMLTKNAFDREAVLRTYLRIRRGDQVPDQELDQVTSWLKLSGIAVRRNALLKVRNTIYEQVFDERWAREHTRLHVNWRRRLTRVAAGLLVMVVLVTIPLAVYAWRLKNEAEARARDAQAQRDEAMRQRETAIQSTEALSKALAAANGVVEQLRQYNPTSANAIANDVASTKEEVEKRLGDLNAQPRADPPRAEPARAERNDPPKPDVAPASRAGSPSPPSSAPKTSATPRPERPAVPTASSTVTPPPAPSPRAADEDAIRRTFRTFEAAYQNKNFDTLKRVQSGADQRVFQRTFENVFDYRVVLKDLEFQFQSDRKATVITKVTEIITTQDGGKTTVGTVINYPTLTLDKSRDGWIIVTPVVTR